MRIRNQQHKFRYSFLLNFFQVFRTTSSTSLVWTYFFYRLPSYSHIPLIICVVVVNNKCNSVWLPIGWLTSQPIIPTEIPITFDSWKVVSYPSNCYLIGLLYPHLIYIVDMFIWFTDISIKYWLSDILAF